MAFHFNLSIWSDRRKFLEIHEVNEYLTFARYIKAVTSSTYYQKEGIFDTTREYFTTINLDFDKKENFSSHFRWDIKCVLKESARNIISLKKNVITKVKHKFSPDAPALLSDARSLIIFASSQKEKAITECLRPC
ncbi:hypothetical protein BD770DRAFT_405768 [Pilaira anomala]|nr:hypothetical protein BD770DRAFT_405768 [Pilaira anomala]